MLANYIADFNSEFPDAKVDVPMIWLQPLAKVSASFAKQYPSSKLVKLVPSQTPSTSTAVKK